MLRIWVPFAGAPVPVTSTLELMSISSLSHQVLVRQGSNSNGCTVAERRSVDFLVDGQSLLQALAKIDGGHADFMGCLVKGFPEQNKAAAASLLLSEPPNTESGRVLLYICPECGDIGCGAYSTKISKVNSAYVWESFAYENGYEEPRIIESFEPLCFDASEYEKAILQATTL